MSVSELSFENQEAYIDEIMFQIDVRRFGHRMCRAAGVMVGGYVADKLGIPYVPGGAGATGVLMTAVAAKELLLDRLEHN